MIRRNLLKIAWSVVACVVSLVVAARLFEWNYISTSLAEMDYVHMVSRCILVLILMFAIRGLRWVAIADLPFDVRTIGHAYLYVAVSSTLAMVTPLQLGEAAKLSLARRFSGLELASGAPAFVLERLMDVIVLTALFSMTGLIRERAAWIALGLPCAVLALLCLWFAPVIARRWSGNRWARIIERSAITGPRFCGAVLLSVGTWCLTALLWDVAVRGVGVTLEIEGLITLLFGVTVSVIASLTPSGIGVSELSVHAILVAQGVSPPAADSVAIVLRLLTILALVVGGIHGLVMMFVLRMAPAPMQSYPREQGNRG